MIDSDDCGAISGLNEWQGKLKYSEETCLNVTLSTTDPTGLGPGSNPGPCGGKPATDRLRYGTACTLPYFYISLRVFGIVRPTFTRFVR
jgi:hypothetical protein